MNLRPNRQPTAPSTSMFAGQVPPGAGKLLLASVVRCTPDVTCKPHLFPEPQFPHVCSEEVAFQVGSVGAQWGATGGGPRAPSATTCFTYWNFLPEPLGNRSCAERGAPPGRTSPEARAGAVLGNSPVTPQCLLGRDPGRHAWALLPGS